MSYDPEYNVTPLQQLAESMGIHSDYIDKSKIVGDDETEPKAEIFGDHLNHSDQKYFDAILRYLEEREDIFLIPQSYRDDKSPMINISMDTNVTQRTPLVPALEFFHRGQELRFRGEMQIADAQEGRLKLLKRDWTNKTIGACGQSGIDNHARDELDAELRNGPRAKVGYKSLVKRARQCGNYLSAHVPFQDLRVIGGYPTVRNTYAFAMQTQINGHPVFLVLEPCEDRWFTHSNRFIPTIDQSAGLNYIKQFEFELKGVIGLPSDLGDQETKNKIRRDIRQKLYSLRDDLCRDVNGFQPIDRSKSTFTLQRLPKPTIGRFGKVKFEDIIDVIAEFENAHERRANMAPRKLIAAAHTGNTLKESLDKYGPGIIDLTLEIHQRRDDARATAHANRIEGFRAPSNG